MATSIIMILKGQCATLQPHNTPPSGEHKHWRKGNDPAAHSSRPMCTPGKGAWSDVSGTAAHAPNPLMKLHPSLSIVAPTLDTARTHTYTDAHTHTYTDIVAGGGRPSAAIGRGQAFGLPPHPTPHPRIRLHPPLSMVAQHWPPPKHTHTHSHDCGRGGRPSAAICRGARRPHTYMHSHCCWGGAAFCPPLSIVAPTHATAHTKTHTQTHTQTHTTYTDSHTHTYADIVVGGGAALCRSVSGVAFGRLPPHPTPADKAPPSLPHTSPHPLITFHTPFSIVASTLATAHPGAMMGCQP